MPDADDISYKTTNVYAELERLAGELASLSAAISAIDLSKYVTLETYRSFVNDTYNQHHHYHTGNYLLKFGCRHLVTLWEHIHNFLHNLEMSDH